MPRKPARLERAGALTPRDRMWAAMRAMGGFFSAVEVQLLANLKAPGREAHVHIDTVLSYVEGLAKAEPPYLMGIDTDVPGRTRAELRLHRLVRDVGVDAPRVNKHGKPVTQGLGNELLWGAMKVLREFDYAELVEAVAGPARAAGVSVSGETAKSYCIALCRAGYLALAAPNNGPHAKSRYRFNRAKNTGPRAPLVCKDKSVMDANTGTIEWNPKAPTRT